MAKKAKPVLKAKKKPLNAIQKFRIDVIDDLIYALKTLRKNNSEYYDDTIEMAKLKHEIDFAIARKEKMMIHDGDEDWDD